MVGFQKVFARAELKYLINKEQREIIENGMSKYMRPDEHGESLICGMYFDTPDNLLVRRSIDKPIYKEKLRMRSYGVPEHNSRVFVELKKKYNRITYKRRVDMTEKEAMDFLCHGVSPKQNNQITDEINYFINHYEGIAPSMYISYERTAFFDKTNPQTRITFDKNITWRDYDLSLCKGSYGQKLLEGNKYMMEVKVFGGMPLWLAKLLNENDIYRTSFSKYGKAYVQKTEEKILMSRGVTA